VTPIVTATNTAGTPITVGSAPWAIAITPDGKTAYVVNRGSGTVTPIVTATNIAGTPITVGSYPYAIAITPAPVTEGPTGPIVSGYRKTKCVTDLSYWRANGPDVVIGDCGRAAGQKWTIETNGTISIDGKSLDTGLGHSASNGLAQLADCTGAASQQWQSRRGALVSPASGKCLDDPAFNVTDGTHLDIRGCTGRANQQWRLPS
jgi:YVTN family beta-propeller protein